MSTDGNDRIASVDELQRVIDPEVWAARYEDQRTLGQQATWEKRRRWSTEAACRVHAFLADRRPVR